MIVQAAPARGSVRRRPRRSLALGLVGFAGARTGGVRAEQHARPPTTTSPQNSFLQSCTGDAPEYNGTSTTLAGTDYCGCAYQVFVENVPYNDEDKTEPPRPRTASRVFANYSGKTTSSTTPS